MSAVSYSQEFLGLISIVLLSSSCCHKSLEDTGYRKRTSLVKFLQNQMNVIFPVLEQRGHFSFSKEGLE